MMSTDQTVQTGFPPSCVCFVIPMLNVNSILIIIMTLTLAVFTTDDAALHA